jgi:hypothetical protein
MEYRTHLAGLPERLAPGAAKIGCARDVLGSQCRRARLENSLEDREEWAPSHAFKPSSARSAYRFAVCNLSLIGGRTFACVQRMCMKPEDPRLGKYSATFLEVVPFHSRPQGLQV